MTEYVILMQDPDHQERWTQITAMQGRSARAAIAAALEGDENPFRDGGVFIAVPLRSWRPVRARQETKTTLTFS